MSNSIRCVCACAATLLATATVLHTEPRAQTVSNPTFKVAYYNIQSGMGTACLTGTCSFQRNANCTDPSQPLNAWGVGVVQAELDAALNGDSAVIALGLGEAWACASPEAVRKALGWAAHTGERNGVSLVARYGFAGPAEWFQLDTSLNSNPSDTMWVVRAPVCADAVCSRSMEVLSAHWYASGDTRTESYERQARGTAEFMDRLPQTEPRVLVGDLNVWEEGGTVCNQTPVPTAMQILRDAGNLDAWPAANGTAEGYTAIWNRNGCGNPNGYLWKRIDQGWSKALPAPVSMTRFGMVTPGACAPSDHAGILVEYAWPGVDATPPTVAVTTPAAGSVLAGTAVLAASASDDAAVAKVGFTVDGAQAGGDSTAPYEIQWDSTTVANGSHVVSAWAEDAAGNRGLSQNVSVSVDNSAPSASFDFSLSVSPSLRRINSGAKTSFSVTATVTGGGPLPVALSVTGLPAGTSAVFDPASITGSGSSTLRIGTAKSTPQGIYPLTIAGTAGGITRSAQVSLEVTARR